MRQRMQVQIVKLLKQRAKELGSQAECARQLGITNGHLSHLLKGNRQPGPKVLDALGLRAVIRYEKTNGRDRHEAQTNRGTRS